MPAPSRREVKPWRRFGSSQGVPPGLRHSLPPWARPGGGSWWDLGGPRCSPGDTVTLSLGPQFHRGANRGCGWALAVVPWVTRSLERFLAGGGWCCWSFPGQPAARAPLPALLTPCASPPGGAGSGVPREQTPGQGCPPPRLSPSPGIPPLWGSSEGDQSQAPSSQPRDPQTAPPWGPRQPPSGPGWSQGGGAAGGPPLQPSRSLSRSSQRAVLGRGGPAGPPLPAPLRPGPVPLLTSFSFSCRTSSSWSGHSRGTRPLSPPPAR